VDSFASTFTVDGEADFVVDAAGSAVDGAFAAVGKAGALGALQVGGYVANAQGMLARARAVLSNPLVLAQEVIAFLGLSDLSGGLQPWGDITRSVLRLAQDASLAAADLGSFLTPSRRVAATNEQAVRELVRLGLVAQAVGASSFVGSSADASNSRSYDDQLAIRNDLIAAIDAESMRTRSDVTYDALQVARSRVWLDLTERSRNSARLTTVTPPGVTPALVLAYDLYEDAQRDEELVTRNRVSHPGFVPARALKVLTR